MLRNPEIWHHGADSAPRLSWQFVIRRHEADSPSQIPKPQAQVRILPRALANQGFRCRSRGLGNPSGLVVCDRSCRPWQRLRADSFWAWVWEEGHHARHVGLCAESQS